MAVTPYLFLDGRCEEAIEFYKKNLGAQVGMMMRFKEAPADHKAPPGTENKIMHASITINGAPIMLSDGMAKSNKPEFKGFSLSLDARDPSEGKRMFEALSQGGQVQQPLVETFFAKSFGMVADKFGVGWMIIAGPKNP
jgi:PhnB protein